MNIDEYLICQYNALFEYLLNIDFAFLFKSIKREIYKS